MSDKNSIIIKPFQNEVDSAEVSGMTIENHIDRVVIYGSTEITADRIGYDAAMKIHSMLGLILDEMNHRIDTGHLPAKVEFIEPSIVKNPLE